ncbi:putative odorant receptor 85e [Cryptotermes secundus]|uniref:putative odorant receptor 85e n=1 Tax=Cryptotermes secundus TaxID=105785 RepID=UPI001454D385|nr:putative odorant receptor 85e [Cryptotermes secundus]
MAGWVFFLGTVIRRTVGIVMSYFLMHAAVTLLISHERVLLFNAWFPFDWTVSPTYELICLQQFIGSCGFVFTVFSFPGLYATLVCIACSQLEKLRANLLDIRQEFGTPAQDSGAETDTEEEEQVQTSQEVFCRMQGQLSDCVRFHNEILRYMEEMENTFNPFMTGIFLLSLTSLCLSSFSIVTSWGNVYMMIQGFVAYSAVIFPVALYSWFGNQLTIEAEKVREAAWGCDWVGTPISFQKCIRLIIAVANKEFTLTAGKFVPVAIRTMVNMVNQSISYFMFLLQLKDNIELDEPANSV